MVPPGRTKNFPKESKMTYLSGLIEFILKAASQQKILKIKKID